MNDISVTFAKLAGLQKLIQLNLDRKNHSYESETLDYFKRYSVILANLKILFPELYADLPELIIPKLLKVSPTSLGTISFTRLSDLARQIAYIFEVRSHSEIGAIEPTKPRKIFISHGTSKDWLELQAYVEKTLNIPTLELAQEASNGRTIMQKLDQESNNCSYAIIVMTGDDNFENRQIRARENVMHEIGFFQGKYGFSNVCILYEEETSLPSNIHGLVYIPFTKGNVQATFGALYKELNHLK